MSLRWPDERYVRVFTRDTPNWLLGPWQARAVLGPVLRKLDRAGTLDLGEDGLEALAAVVGLPLEVVEPGMAWWLRKRTFELVNGRLVMPNFIDAQEASASDAQRAREHRARARDQARVPDPVVTKRDALVTNRDGEVTERDGTVTASHAASQPVTPSRAVPSLPSRAEPPVPDQPDQIHRSQLALKGSSPADSAESATSSDVREVFNYWVFQRSRLIGGSPKRLKPTPDRKKKIQARLREGSTVDDLKKAIVGMLATPFNVEKGHTDVELCCRSDVHVLRYIALAPTVTTMPLTEMTRLGKLTTDPSGTIRLVEHNGTTTDFADSEAYKAYAAEAFNRSPANGVGPLSHPEAGAEQDPAREGGAT